MTNKDLDFLALLFEELDKVSEPKSFTWMLDQLSGPSFGLLKTRLKEQLPSKYPFWVRSLIFFFLRFKYRRERRLLQNRLTDLIAFSKHKGYLLEQHKKGKPVYTLDESGRQWLEHDYAANKGKIDNSDIQTVYDAVKICKALHSRGRSMHESTLMNSALPESPIPEKAGRMLKAMLSAHNASIPDAFKRALRLAEDQGWIEHQEARWALTPNGRQEGLTFDEHLTQS